MDVKPLILCACLIVTAAGMTWHAFTQSQEASSTFSYTTEEAGFEEIAAEKHLDAGGRYTASELATWERPPGPITVGIQSGHLRNDEVPEELDGLKKNGGGAVGGGENERDVVLVIAEKTAEILRAEGIAVDLLPTTIPPGYLADAFISIHADGNLDTSVSGFKIADPRRDYSGRAAHLKDSLYKTYGQATGLQQDPNISYRMRGYYAFNWRRYDHAIHPMTPAVIVETGFLTNPGDRKIIVTQPQRAAEGIAQGILAYLQLQPEKQ